MNEPPGCFKTLYFLISFHSLNLFHHYSSSIIINSQREVLQNYERIYSFCRFLFSMESGMDHKKMNLHFRDTFKINTTQVSNNSLITVFMKWSSFIFIRNVVSIYDFLAYFCYDSTLISLHYCLRNLKFGLFRISPPLLSLHHDMRYILYHGLHSSGQLVYGYLWTQHLFQQVRPI